jgi:hypothetical protein
MAFYALLRIRQLEISCGVREPDFKNLKPIFKVGDVVTLKALARVDFKKEEMKVGHQYIISATRWSSAFGWYYVIEGLKSSYREDCLELFKLWG